jgi:hypothetical protein
MFKFYYNICIYSMYSTVYTAELLLYQIDNIFKETASVTKLKYLGKYKILRKSISINYTRLLLRLLAVVLYISLTIIRRRRGRDNL